MAAGILNTMRLGSEAIAVAAYGSLLASLVHGRTNTEVLAAAFVGAGLDGEATHRSVQAMVRGDVDAALAGTTGSARAALTVALQRSYDSGFHALLWILTVICVMLAVATALLLRRPAGRA